MRAEAVGFAGEQQEYPLGDILREMRIRTELADRGVVNQAEVAPHEFRERGFRAAVEMRLVAGRGHQEAKQRDDDDAEFHGVSLVRDVARA